MNLIGRQLARLYLAGAGALVITALLPRSTLAQEEIKLTVAAGHPAIFLWVKHLKTSLIPAVDAELAKTGKYKIRWNEAYGGTLAKVGSELETMQQGGSDLGCVATVFQAAKMPLNNVTYYAPYGPADAGAVMTAINRIQAGPDLKGEWDKYNLVYLSGWAIENYAIASNFPITRMEDLQGKKLGGAGPNLAWLRNTGAVGVQGSFVTFYNDIKSGVYQGLIGFITAATPAKIYEVAPYYTSVDMGAMFAGGVAFNKSRFDKLPEEVKDAFRKGGEAYGAGYLAEQSAQIVAATDAWKKAGGKVTVLPAGERLRLVKAMPNPSVEWAKQSGPRAKAVLASYMSAVRSTGYVFPRDFDKE